MRPSAGVSSGLGFRVGLKVPLKDDVPRQRIM